MPNSTLPSSSDPAKRARTVAVRLSDAEHTEWLAAAADAGRFRLGSWARDTVAASLNGRDTVSLRGAAPDPELAKLRGELTRLGNLHNQLTRLARESAFDPASTPDLLEALEGMRRQMGLLREELGRRR